MTLQTQLVEQRPVVILDELTGAIIPPSSDPVEIRHWIAKLARSMKSGDAGEKLELPVKHTFLDGMYMRELFIPKGTMLIGKVHKLPCINIVSSGDISVLTETGTARVKAGYSVVTPVGIQKLGYAHEDTLFVNVFRTDETDPDKIDDVVAFDLADDVLIDMEAAPCLS